MARTQVLVQLDDDLVQRLDRLARDLSVSRSELLRRGARAVLEAADLAEADEALIEAYRIRPQDPSMIEAAGRLAARMVPEW
ncbi:MAG: CopG family transcriptional regulator [Actinomycetota bacterium]|nr:CopG family transcriptional regulator [Actinomycetota bacterium]